MAQLFRRPIRLAWVWLLVPVVGVVVSASLEPIPPHDYWWHLAMGRLIAGGMLPESNLFLYTMPADAPFLNQPWLGQWLLYIVRDLGGDQLNVLVRNALVAAAWAGVVGLAFRRSRLAPVAATLAIFFCIATFPVLTVRTRMFAFVPYVILLVWMVRFAEGERSWGWTVLVAVATAFWVNVHGSFVLAPLLTIGVCGCVVLERWLDDEEIAPTLIYGGVSAGAFVLASFANPLGPEVFVYVFRLAITSTVSGTVTEWKPPDFAEVEGVIFIVGTVAGVLLLAVRRASVKIWEVGLLLAVTYLAAGAIRSIFFWAVTVTVILAPHVAAFFPEGDDLELSGREEALNGILLFMLCVAAILVQPWVARSTLVAATHEGKARSTAPGMHVLGAETPTRAIDQLPEGRGFHHQAVGGFLEWSLAPGEPTQVAFVDQRMELLPDEVWREYFEISSAEGDWQSRLDHWQITWLLLNPRGQWPLIQEALKSTQWRLKYVDEAHVLLVRSGAPGATR